VAVATFAVKHEPDFHTISTPSVLVELKAVEQRYRAVIDVLDGMSVTDVARRNGVSRQSVHAWLRRYADGGMAALADKSSRPETSPHQMPPVVEARVVALRREHPRWGPRSIRTMTITTLIPSSRDQGTCPFLMKSAAASQ